MPLFECVVSFLKKSVKIIAVVFTVILLILLIFGKSIFQPLLVCDTTSAAELYADGEIKNVSLKKDDYVLFGSYLGEKILWRVIDINGDDEPLLWSEYVLTFKAFDAADASAESSENGKFGSQNWKQSSLKIWLNSDSEKVDYIHSPSENAVTANPYENEPGFLSDVNFTESERAKISEKNGVFILSEKEIKNYTEKSDRRKLCTDIAILNDKTQYILPSSKPVWYWTRSASTANSSCLITVTSSGGTYRGMANDGTTGVCPALRLGESLVKCSGGDGEKASPYVIA